MEVVAVSCSMPKELDLGFMKLGTSIIHDPLTAPTDYIEIDATGVVGNKPAAHDGPVYIFFAEHYDYWCSELGVDRSAWDWCHWGENITLRYKKGTRPRFETEMYLGELWRIGSSVRLELCGARIPCQKVSWRCQQKDSWLRPLAESGRVGVYMRVLQGGRVRPGDDVVVEKFSSTSNSTTSTCSTTVIEGVVDDGHQEQQQPSVGMISRIAYDASLKTSDTLDLLANHALLLPMNKRFLAAKKVSLEDRLLAGKNAWKGWRDLRVAKVIQESEDIKSFYLEPAACDDAPLANYLPGQFLSVRVPFSSSSSSSSSTLPEQVRHDVRSWTISDYPTRDGPTYYRLSIKRDRGSSSSSSSTSRERRRRRRSASAWMHDHAAPGTTVLSARAPAGGFVLDWGQPVALRPVYVTAGIGLAPVAAMLGAHARHPKFARTPALWVHVARGRSRADLPRLWGEAVRDLPAAVALERHVFFTGLGEEEEDGGLGIHYEEEEDDEKGKYVVHKRGRPDRETLKAILGRSYRWNPLGAGELEVPAKMSPFYVCGPTSFEATVRECLAEIGVPAANIRSESFTAAAAAATATLRGSDGGGGNLRAEVRFSQSRRTATWSREEGGGKPTSSSLLELAESLGLTPDYGCRVGACGSCAAKLRCGSVQGTDVRPDGTVLTCSATPASDVVEIDL